MGNCIPTTPQRGGDARARAAELTAQYAMQRAAVMAAQYATQPITSNLSYDELVVAEANRRIRAEELRCRAEDLRQIALAEKLRFDADVAERIALQKNPHHVTRAMVADAAQEKARLEKLAVEEQEAKLNLIKDDLESRSMWFGDKVNIELSVPLELYKLNKSSRTNILKKIRDVTAKRDEKYVTDMDVSQDLHPYVPLYNQLVYIQGKLSPTISRPHHPPRRSAIYGVFDVFEDPPALWDDRRDGDECMRECGELRWLGRGPPVWNDKMCTNVIGTIGSGISRVDGRTQVRTLCWERKDKQNSEKRKQERNIAEERRLTKKRNEENAKIIQDLTNGLYGDPNSECISLKDELIRIAKKDLFENKENPVIFRNIMNHGNCMNYGPSEDTRRGHWVYYIILNCQHVPVHNHTIPAQHVTTIHDEVVTTPHNYESVLFNSVCSHKGHGGIVRNRSGFIPCWHDENA
jgi:hypothetical protein